MRFVFFLLCSFPLLSNSQEPMLMLPRGHIGGVEFLEYTLDEKYLISGSDDGTVKFWHANTGRLLFDIKVSPDGIADMKLSPDGSMIAAAGYSETDILVIETKTGKVIRKLSKHTQPVRTLDFSHDSKKLISGSIDESAILWDLTTGKSLTQIQEVWEVRHVDLSPKGDRLIVTTKVAVHIYDLKGKTIADLPTKSYSMESGTFSPSGKYLVTSSHDSVNFWDGNSYKFLAGFRGPQKYCGENPYSEPCPTDVAVKFNSNESQAYFSFSYYASTYKGAGLVSLNNFSVIDLSKVITGEYDDPEFFDNDTKIAVINNDEVFVLSASTGNIISTWDFNIGYNHGCLAISQANHQMAFGNSDGEIALLRSTNITPIVVLKSRVQGIREYVTTNTGVNLYGRFISALNFNTGQLEKTIKTLGYPYRRPIRLTDSFFIEVLYKEVIKRSLFDDRPDTLYKAKNQLKQYDVSKDGNLLVALTGTGNHSSWDKTVQVISLKNGKVLYETTLTNEISGVSFINDSLIMLQYWKAYEVRSLDLDSVKFLNVFVTTFGAVDRNGWFYSKENNQLLTAFSVNPDRDEYDDEYVLWQSWSVPDLKLIKEIKIPARGVTMHPSPNGKEVLLTYYSDEKRIHLFYDLKDLNRTDSFAITHNGQQHSWSPNSEYITYTLPDSNQIVVRTRKNTEVIKLPFPGQPVFSPDSKRLVVLTGEEITTWDIETKSLLYRVIYLDSGELVIQRPDKYYLATPNAARMMYYVMPDLKTIGFDQLDIKYNRPDLVLKTIGSRDSSFIRLYEQAYLKRMAKLKMDPARFTGNFSLPEADFRDRDNISFIQTSQTVTVPIYAFEPAGYLTSFNVWVDNVPLFGANGIDLSTRKISRFDTSVTVHLNHGLNHLTTSVVNTNGTESYRIPLEVKYESAAAPVEKLYFIGVGVNTFKEAGNELNWSVKDIRDLAKELSRKYGNNISIDTLFDQNVEADKVMDLKEKLKKTTIADKVIIAYSGHGLLDSSFDYYLSTWSVDFKDPANGGLAYTALESLLEDIPARKKLLLIDACHSGEVDKEELEKYDLVQKQLADSGTRSGRKPVARDGNVGMKNSFEVMQQLFVNIGKNTGTTIISAASGTQFAQERSNLKNGVFTYSILEFMQSHPTATVSELKSYVNRRVTEITGGMQVPTTRSENLVSDWKVW